MGMRRENVIQRTIRAIRDVGGVNTAHLGNLLGCRSVSDVVQWESGAIPPIEKQLALGRLRFAVDVLSDHLERRFILTCLYEIKGGELLFEEAGLKKILERIYKDLRR